MGGFRLKYSTCALVVWFGCLVFCPLIYGASSFVIDTIALNGTSGNRGPGLGSAVEFAGFGDPAINSSGDATFLGVLTGSTAGHTEGFWINEGNANTPIALTYEEGSLGPGLGSGVYFDNMLGDAIGGGNGEWIFFGFIAGAGVDNSNRELYVRHTAAGNIPFARPNVSNHLGPGLGAQITFTGFNSPSVNADGIVAFGSGLQGPGITPENARGFWRNSIAGNAIFAQTGTGGVLGPGLGDDRVFGADNFSPFGIVHISNGSADAIFAGATRSPSSATIDIGLWKNSSGLNAPLAISGVTDDRGPGLGSTVTFAHKAQLPAAWQTGGLAGLNYRANGLGDTVFNNFLSDGRRGVWRNLGDRNEPIMLQGETGNLGPGLPGKTFAAVDPYSIFSLLSISSNKTSLFSGLLSGTQQQGLWLNEDGVNRPIALTGDDGLLGPDLGPGVKFTGFNRAYFAGDDTVFFTADLSYNVPFNRLLGLFAYYDGAIHKIVVYNESFDVDPSDGVDSRLVRWVQIASDSTSGEFGANNLGQVGFRMAFQDGTQGIFTTQWVPEPTSWLLLLFGGVSILLGGRWKLVNGRGPI